MRRIVAIAIAAYLLLVFLDRFVLVELLVRRVGISILFATATALACIGAGSLARRLRGDIALNFIVGYPIFGTLCFLVALLRISTWTMVPIVGMLGGIGLISVGQAILPVRAGGIAGPTLRTLPLIAIAAVAVSAFIMAQAPPTSLDEVSYHLAVPWTWVKEGRAIELPLISHSYFPLGVESADLPFLTILGTGGGTASHFLHLFAAIAVAALLLRATRECPLITVAIITTPALALTAGWSLVDWPLLGICLALVMAIDEDDGATISAAIAAGLLTKYTFIPFAVIALAVTRRWRGVLPGIAAGSVFFIRNLILTGDPVAPFFSALAPDVAHYRAGAYLSDYIFDGHFIDESLGASLLGTVAMTSGMLAWILVVAGAILFLLAPSARILIPFFAVPATRANLRWRPLRIVVAVAAIAQLFLVGYFLDRTEVLSLVSGRVSDEQYLANSRPSSATIGALDAVLPPTSRTLVIGLNETFWFTHRVRGGGNFDGPRVSSYLDTGTAEALYGRLKRDGITHVAVVSAPPPTAIARKVEERETELSAGAQKTVAEMLDHYTVNVAPRGNATLFTLR